MSAALNAFIVKVRLQCVGVVMKYVCQFVCQSSLVQMSQTCLVSCLSHFPAVFILSSLSLPFFEIVPPQQAQLKVSTLEMEK